MNRGSPGSSMARASVLHKQQQRPSRRPHAAFRYAGPHTPVPRNAGTAHRAIPAPYYHSGRHPPHKKTYRLKNNRYCGRARRQRRALPVAEGKRPQGACLTKRVRAKEVAPTNEPNAVAGKPVSQQAIHGTGTQIRHANNRTLSPRTAPQAFTGRFHSDVTLSLYFAGNGSFFNYFFIYLQVKKNKPV